MGLKYQGVRDEIKNRIKIKIRPKWDWNFWSARKRHLWDTLKSDQNGIEISESLEVGAHPAPLKSDQNGIEMYPSIMGSVPKYLIKIRPKWDWNCQYQWHLFPSYTIKIRPKWDWNHSEHSTTSSGSKH